MKKISAKRARAEFMDLTDEVAQSYRPVLIRGKHADAVLVSAATWRGLKETLYLQSIPGMVESIREGMESPPEERSEDLDWGQD